MSGPPDDPHLPPEDVPGVPSGGGPTRGAGDPGGSATGGDRPVAQHGDPDAAPLAPRRSLADGDPWRPASGARRDPRQTGEMPFLKHLEELRIVLVHCAIGAVVGTIAGWLLAPYVLRDLIRRTVKTAIVLAPIEAFNERFKMALIIGVLVAGPYIFYRIWLFIVPGLLKRERAMVIPLAVLSLSLFLAGVAAAYFYIVPLVIQVLSGFLVAGMQAQFRVADVLNFFYNVALACGVICQLPLVTMGLTALGIVTPKFLLKQWRYAIVGAFIITAAITPGDVVTAQIILGFPMAALYFLSVGLSFFVARKKRAGETPAGVTAEEADRV